MARALVLGRLKTQFLGVESVTTGTDRTIAMPVDNRVLKAAWLSILNAAVRTFYGIIQIRLGGPGETLGGIHLAEGWVGAAAHVTGDDAMLLGEGIAWFGELPVFELKRTTRIMFNARNDTGATITFTGGYAWQEFEENDRPS